MSTWAKATIPEQIKAGTCERLTIGNIANLIAESIVEKEAKRVPVIIDEKLKQSKIAELERSIIIEMTRDYMAVKLRANGDCLSHLVRVLRSGWLVGKWHEAGELVPVNQEQYTANQPFIEIVESPYLTDFTVKLADYVDYLKGKPPLPTDCILKEWIDDKISNIKGIYARRDFYFKEWMTETQPNLTEMTKDEIQNHLMKRNSKLWASGFEDWWQAQTIFRAKRGRKPTKIA